jgi:hypothetical protein
MAVSLGFGVLGATGITLLLIPCGYLIREDLLAMAKGCKNIVFGACEDESLKNST